MSSPLTQGQSTSNVAETLALDRFGVVGVKYAGSDTTSVSNSPKKIRLHPISPTSRPSSLSQTPRRTAVEESCMHKNGL